MVVSSLTCLTIFMIGSRAFGLRVGTCASWVWVFWPYALWYSTYEIWETSLSALLMSGIFLMALLLETSTRTHAWVCFGLLWGVSALTNPALLAVLPFFLGYLCHRRHARGLTCSRMVPVTLLTLCLVIAPWLLRNYFVFGKVVFLRDNFGMELFLGNNAWSNGTVKRWLYPWSNPVEMENFTRMGELPYYTERQHEAVNFIFSHRSLYAWFALNRFTHFWRGKDYVYIFRVLGRHADLQFRLSESLSLLAFLGVAAGFRKGRPEAVLFTLVLAIYPLVYYVTHTAVRYRHPIEPEMILLAVYAVTIALSLARAHIQGPRG
jgi:hypothetical protein